MIQVNELRIGNWVDLNDGTGKDDIREVLSVFVNGITTRIKGCGVASAVISANKIYPIPLTEEILLKCGFEEDGEDENKYIISGNICDYIMEKSPDSTFFIGVNHGDSTLYFSWDIIHVHQLQNLYYSLTGEELEVNL